MSSQTKKLIKKRNSSSEQSTINKIKYDLQLTDTEENQLNNSKVSNTSTESSLSSNSNSHDQNYFDSIEYLQFEDNFKNYYVDSSKNNNGNYDNYISNALKLITLIPQTLLKKIPEKVKNISNSINFNSIKNSNKKLLILDLDETLIHSDVDRLLDQKKTKYDAVLNFFDSDDQQNTELPILLRPGLFEFLDYASENFDLVIFTASEKLYADKIIDYIEKDKKYFKMRLYREHCIFIEPGLYIKNLNIFKPYKKIKDIIIVDNSLFSFANQLNNGILVTSFFDDENDSFLISLKEYLNMIKDVKDFREINKENFQFESYKENILRYSK